MRKLTLILLLIPMLLNAQAGRRIASGHGYPGATYVNGSSYWFAPHNSAFNFGTGNFTMVAVIKYSSIVDANGRIFDKYTLTTAQGYLLVAIGTNNYLSVTLSSGGSNNVASQSTGTGLNDGKPHLVAATITRGDSIRLYVDGQRVATAQTTLVGTLDNTDSLVIGQALEVSRAFRGFIGSCQLISGVLTDAEIAQLAVSYKTNGLRPYYSSSTTVRGWWDWEAGGYDRSGNSNAMRKGNNPIIMGIQTQ